MNDDDDFLDDDVEETDCAEPSHIMLIVDDESGVHDVTRLALRGFRFAGGGIEMISAYSARDAQEILSSRDDVAVVLLDVVMETESAGLDLVRTIRDELGNTDIRIILRTGQPGQAPEEKVIVDYDINDYKAKSELTRSHLITSVIAALRAWRDIQELHYYRRQAYSMAGRQMAVVEAAIALIERPVAVLDMDGLIVAANSSLSALAGKPPDELIGFDPAQLGLGEVGAALAAAAVNDLETADTVTLEAGSWLVTLRAVRAPDGTTDGLLMRLDPA